MHNLGTIRKKSEPEVIVLLGNKPAESHSKPLVTYPEKITFEKRDIRVAWLRQSGADYTKVSRLLGRCTTSGLRVQLFEGIDSSASVDIHRELLLHADMVLLEAFGRIGRDTHEGLLSHVRQYSIAPVVMLTEDASAERSITALKAGADAVVLLNMPEEVIIARFNSLLRRWFHPSQFP